MFTGAKGKILEFFFVEPEKRMHVKGLARAIGISAGSASRVCGELAAQGVLAREESANALFYSLNNSSALVKQWKRTWFLEKIELFKKNWENEEFQSVALYGSYASGEFVSKSDVDFLVVTNVGHNKVFNSFKPLSDSLRPEVNPHPVSVGKWLKMAEERDRFYVEVLANHVLLYGAPLVVE
ncbi:hypothetical protein COU38_01720 [Candidatus Micrarchaeota archaeon CG10_big_fil_rev_8_21_14_0_10_54_18]|nr:MAG: hypothetical protein COU38_01720 [Candidatus Micrarchaeota archaeon CG10_big_fil_rev_8_21_14_0_10_54_18]